MICFNCYSLMDEIKNTGAKLVMNYYFCRKCGSYGITPNPKIAPTVEKLGLEVKETPIYKQVERCS